MTSSESGNGRPATGAADGEHVAWPCRLSRPGWRQVLARVRHQAEEDDVSLLAAGVAFYAMLSLFPALAALTTISGLVFDPADIQGQVETITRIVPESTRQLLLERMDAIIANSQQALTIGLVAALVVTLWTASTGMYGLVRAVNRAYNERETRSFVALRALSLILTLGAFCFLVISMALIAVVPAILHLLGLERGAEMALVTLRWPLLATLVFAALAVVYRYAPDRTNPQWRWVSIGSLAATILWLLASLGFSVYVSHFGSYDRLYGSLGAGVLLLLWLFLSAFSVLLGAEINAEIERQTLADTTVGPQRPRGERGAVVADSPPGGPSDADRRETDDSSTTPRRHDDKETEARS